MNIDQLKNYIGKYESGNDYSAYNTKLPNGKWKGSYNTNLTNMTIGEVMAAQERGEMFATGRYQVIGSTLKGAVSALGLSRDQKYDAKTQELIFDKYLITKKRPAISAYLNGNGSIDDAMLAVAQEWEFAPVQAGVQRHKKGIARGGESYYGPDKALATLDSLRGALTSAAGGVYTPPANSQGSGFVASDSQFMEKTTGSVNPASMGTLTGSDLDPTSASKYNLKSASYTSNPELAAERYRDISSRAIAAAQADYQAILAKKEQIIPIAPTDFVNNGAGDWISDPSYDQRQTWETPEERAMIEWNNENIAYRDNMYGQGAGGLIRAHLDSSYDKFMNSVPGTAVRAAFTGNLPPVANLYNAYRNNGNDESMIDTMMRGASPFERVEPDFSGKEKGDMIARFKEEYDVDMGQNWQDRIKSASNRRQANDAYEAAIKQAGIDMRMSQSGAGANIGAAAVASLLSIQDLPVNLAGGFVVRGASAVAKSASLAEAALTSRIAAGVQSGAANLVATGARRAGTEGFVSGGAAALAGGLYNTEYTFADASADVLVGGALGIGLSRLGSAIGRVLSGENYVGPETIAARHIENGLEKSVERARQLAVETRMEINQAAARTGIENPTDAIAEAQASIISGKEKPTSVIMRETVPVFVDERSSPALKADLQKVSGLVQAFKFTKEVVAQMSADVQKKLNIAGNTAEDIAAKSETMAKGAADNHAQRMVAAEQAVVTAQDHVNVRTKAEAAARADLQSAQEIEIVPTDKDVQAIVTAENKLSSTLDKIDTISAKADAHNAKFNELTSQIDTVRKTTGNAKELEALSNKAARRQLASIKATEKAQKLTKKLAKLEETVADLTANPREAISIKEGLVNKATAALSKATDNLNKANEVHANRGMELEELRNTSTKTAADFTQDLSAKNADKLIPEIPLTLDDLNEIQGGLDRMTIRQMAEELGVLEFMQGNDLYSAVKIKHQVENSKVVNKLLREDARVAEKIGTAEKTNKFMNSNSVLAQVNTSATAMTASKAEVLQNFSIMGVENASGAYGGVTSAVEAHNMHKAIVDPVLGTQEAALREFSKNAGALVIARSPKISNAFAELERAMVDMRLAGKSNADLKKLFPNEMTPTMERHIDTALESLEKLNELDWRSKGNVGNPPKITHMPIRWNHSALSVMAQDQTAMKSFRNALVDSVKASRDQRVSQGVKSTLTDQEIDGLVGDYMSNMFSNADGQGFGYISLKNREFNLWKATEEMISMHGDTIAEGKASTYRKLEALYKTDNKALIDLEVKFKDKDGREFSLSDQTKPSVTDAITRMSSYKTGVIALRNIGIDVERPKELAIIRSAAMHQGATKEEMYHFDSVIAQFTKRRFGDGKPSVGFELISSLTRNNMLGGLVFAQLSEISGIASHVGLIGSARILSNFGRLWKEAKEAAIGINSKGALEDIQKHLGFFGVEGYRPAHVYDPTESGQFLDMMDMKGEKALDMALAASRTAEQFQAKITFFTAVNAVMKRGLAEEYARSVAVAVRHVQSGAVGVIPNIRVLTSAGIGEDRIRKLAKVDGLFHWDGNKFMGTSLDKISDPTLAADTIGGIRRGMGQAVQETFIGETGKWVNSPFLRFMLTFRGFMLGSIEKQMVRQFSDFGASKFAINTMVGMIFGGAVITARTLLAAQFQTEEQREKTMERAFSPVALGQSMVQYSTQLGSLQEVYNLIAMFSKQLPSQTRMGSQTGLGEIFPTLSYSNKLVRLGGGIGGLTTGEATDYVTGSDDNSASENAKAIADAAPFANSLYFKASIARLLDEWREEDKREKKKAYREESRRENRL